MTPETDLFDTSLLAKYNRSGPRYTSYPTALEFNTLVNDLSLIDAAQTSPTNHLSLYVHIPFCHQLCFYCGCNKMVTRHSDKADTYLDYLEQEIALRRQTFSRYQVAQLHLGGGSPSFLSIEQHTRLHTLLRSAFAFLPNAECSIEIDPRNIDKAYIGALADLGFKRISIGVQDINLDVQMAINRVQSIAHIAELVSHAKTVGFASVNLDLIYGLPHQTEQTLNTTLTVTKAIEPDRISLFSYAHLPNRFAAQRKIKSHWLPNAQTKLAMQQQAIHSLTRDGYVMIGMDHFAKQTDELTVAQRAGTLHRNFQGYSTLGGLDLLGLGVSSISSVHNVYGQNPKALKDYYAALTNCTSLIAKGTQLTQDDLIRRDVIMALMCNLHLDISHIENKWKIQFSEYFSDALNSLGPFIDDGLLTLNADAICISPKARAVIRTICMSFDAYLTEKQHQQRYSRVI